MKRNGLKNRFSYFWFKVVGFVLIASCLSGSDLAAQNQFDFDQLSIEDGLTASWANAIVQDRNGFIWIGTWNGLNRYDGKDIVIYQPEYRDSSSLLNREVTALFEGHDGNIWIGTSSGLSVLDTKTNAFTHYSLDYFITDIYEDDKLNLWVATNGNGLFLVNFRTGEKQQYLQNEVINKIFEDSRNEFWLATGNGLINFNRETKSYLRLLSNPLNRKEFENRYANVQDIAESADGHLWVATFLQGVYRLQTSMNLQELDVEDFTPVAGIKNRFALHANNVEFDCNGNLWIGTYGNGVYMYDVSNLQEPDIESVQVYHNNISDPFSLGRNDNISTIYSDWQGQLWIASTNINVTNLKENGILRFNTQSYTNNVLKNSWVNSLIVSPNDELWVGTDDGLIIYDNYSSNSKQRQYIPGSRLSRSNEVDPEFVKSVQFDQDGNAWLGTSAAGIILYPKPARGKYRKERTITLNQYSTPSIGAYNINQIIVSKTYKNTIWAATNNNGLVKCTYENGRVTVKKYLADTTANSLSHNTIRVIAEDHDGRVWIGTQNGLDVLNPVTGKIRKFYYSFSNERSINNNIINAICVDSDNKVWIGSNSGVNLVVDEKNEGQEDQLYFRSFTSNKYMKGEIVQNILEDDHHNIWVGVYDGIIKFNTQTEDVVDEFFLKEYSRVSISRLSAYKDKNGNFLFGGGNGFLTFHPDKIGTHNETTEVQLTNLMVYNKTVGIGDTINKKILLNKSITYTDTLWLNYRHNVFTIFFSVMDFIAADRCEYAYKLNDFDTDWNYIQSRNSATYTGIAPGKYTFMVKGCNSNGVWSEHPRELTIIISPPWWKTSFAYVALLIIVVTGLFLIERRYIIRLKVKNTMIIDRVKLEKEHELNDLKLHFFTNITHELRTPLTLILGPVEEMAEQKEKLGVFAKNIDLIEKNAKRLLRLINQLMEFRKVETSNMDVRLSRIDINHVLHEIYEAFKGMAATKNIQFNLKQKEEKLWADIDLDKFDKILFNLLSNAFKFTDEGGEVELICGMTQNGNAFYVEISDTGIGIPLELQERIFERFFQINQNTTLSTGGIGLYLTKAFVELHKGKIDVSSELGNGATFRIELPLTTTSEQANKTGQKEQIDEDTLTAVDHIEEATAGNDVETKPYILIAEDDLELNEFLKSSLTVNYRVKSSFDGKSALEIARRSNPDLIITDVMMPEMDGFELANALKNDFNTSHIPILFLTAKTTLKNEIEGLKSGAVDYIYKPFSMVSLKLKIRNILNNRELLKDRYRKNEILQPQKITLTSIDEGFLQDAVKAVDKHLDDPDLDVEKLSYLIGLSPNQTYRKLKALTGQTAKEFIRTQRLKAAADMLIQQKRSVAEIIYMVGFSSPSYFSRCFREFYGCTPTEYIENNKS